MTHQRLPDTRIDEHVRDILESAHAPGAAIALIIDGQWWSEGIGWATPDREARLAASARFGVYSVTKVVIATIVMKLAESGAVVLDAPIQEYVPGIPISVPVQVRQVLNHTGGFPDYGGRADYHEAVRLHPESPWSEEDFLEGTLGDGLLFAPGNGWRYSNIGYMLLRMAIELVTGGSFQDAVRQFVELDVVNSLADMAALTAGYSGDPSLNIIPRYHPGWVSHGLVASTASELAAFLDILMTGSMVSPEPLHQMLVSIPVGETHPWMTTPSYGFGLMIDPDNRFGVVAGHTGGGPGYSTAAYHFPNVNGQHVTSVALVNRDGRDTATDIAFSVVERLAEPSS